jgi:sugar phosphate isomerase/epimerase
MPLAVFPKCFLNAMCVTREMTVDGWINMAAQFDVDGYEFYWPFTPHERPAELERIKQLVEAQGRSIPMMCYSPDFTKPDPAERRAEVEAEKVAIRTCPLLGVKYIRVLSGQRRAGVSRADGIRWVAECIHDLLPEAEKQGVTLILENHYKDSFWSYPEFAQRRELFLELLEAIGRHPNFGVNFDPSNSVIAGEDPISLLEAVLDRVVTMHASDRYFEGGSLEDLMRIDLHPNTGYAGILQHGVIGKGLNDYDRIFSMLKSAGFSGWVSIEDGADPVTGPGDIAASASFLREKMRLHGLA